MLQVNIKTNKLIFSFEKEIEIFHVNHEENDDQFLKSLDFMDADESERIKSLVCYKDKRSFAITRYALKKILADKSSLNLESISIQSLKGQKPSACNDYGAHFNVSHSDTDSVICVSQNYDVGIDLEPVSSSVFCSELSDCVLTAREKEIFHSLLPEEKKQFFLKCWTAKEAYCKLLGCGITENFKNLEITLGQESMIKKVDQSEIHFFWSGTVKNHCICVAFRHRLGK
ncbi:hypothetical protein AA0242T_2249 [Acetobacter aceti NRIC 0242]|uniref:4'-phosphopantetheinyl transferase n=1 Tax=Acetobacter aceti NBRC 14818 TaxID=887700 RepID=A0AB33IKZ0_ACEAC|nr:4'-phosphopantetheinyl transferase superfamily protein [Acetobacter aceti]BCK76572.1 hypothetical protein EMQ_2178 [Acetobacter aceti NBRC 14818]GAN58593.1 4'-phosphopantetheinyl transferase [Acetobacter aceti NBRC 14818]GBO81547.1 hypothetical protein AA0242T_2249 [Acetobacter aceti NRIC 0242]